MAQIDFEAAGFKGFIARHVEKIVLGLCVALVALFFCLGYGIDTMPSDKTPTALFREVYEGNQHILKPSWDVIGPSRTVERNHFTKVVESRKKIDGSFYASNEYWLWPTQKFEDRRQDPELYKPEEVIADSFVTWVPFKLGSSESDPLRAMPDARLVVVEEKPKPAPKKRTPRRRRRGGGDEEEEFDDAGEFEEEEFDDAGDDASGDEGGSGGQAGGLLTLSRSQVDEIFKDRFQLQHDLGSFPGIRNIVAIRAVVPLRKQFEEYQRALGGAMGYSPVAGPAALFLCDGAAGRRNRQAGRGTCLGRRYRLGQTTQYRQVLADFDA